MRTGFLLWASVIGLTGSLALPVQEKGKQQNDRLTRSPQFIPNSAAFLGNFNGIPVFQQSPFQQSQFQQSQFQQIPFQQSPFQQSQFFNQQVLVQDPALFGQQSFGPVELVQFQNQFQQGNNQFQNQFQQGNNQFQGRTGALEQNAATLGLNQFQTVPVVVEILDKTTGNNEPELPGSVRTTSSFGTHRFNLGQNNETPIPVEAQQVQTPTPIEMAKSLSQMISRLSSSASKVENIGKSATAEPLVSKQIKENNDNLAVPDVLSSLLAIGTRPSTPVTVQRKEFKKSTPLSATVTESTVTKIPSSNQAQQGSFSARTGGAQIPGAVAFDNMKMVLGMLGSSVVPTTQVKSTVAPKQTTTTTEVPVTQEPSAAEQIVLEIMSRLSSQPSDRVNDATETVNGDIPQLLSGPEIVTPVIMVLSQNIEEAQERLLNNQKNAAQPEFVIVFDDVAQSTNGANPKKINVGELALKIASESTRVEVPKVKVDPKAKNPERTANSEFIPVTNPLVDINQNLIRKRLGVASNDDVGIEHIFLKSAPGAANNNLIPDTVDTAKNTTSTATLEDIMKSLNSQMVAMVSPSGTLILIPMANLTQEILTTSQLEAIMTGQEGISLTTVAATTSKPTTPALTSTTTNVEATRAPTPTTAPEILAAPASLSGIEKILDAMKSAQNIKPLEDTNQKKAAVVKPTEVLQLTHSATLDTLEKVIETMEAALVNVTSNSNTAVPLAVMQMIDEVISTMEVSLVNVTTRGEPDSITPQTMETLNQALTNMTNALEALQSVMDIATPPTTPATVVRQEFKKSLPLSATVTKSPIAQQAFPNQQVRVLGQIVPNQGIIPSGTGRSLAAGRTQARPVPRQPQPVSIRRFMTIPIASSQSSGAQARFGFPVLSPVTVADQVSSILRSRISNGATRGGTVSIVPGPGGVGFRQRSGAQRRPNQPIPLADQLGAEIASHLIGII